jgi:phage head maturation protease
MWDVSVVDTPFYDSTSVYTRSFELLESEEKRLESLSELELRKRKLIAKLKMKERNII